MVLVKQPNSKTSNISAYRPSVPADRCKRLDDPLDPAAAVALRSDRRKRLADPLGPATAVADVSTGAAVAVAAAPWNHRSPLSHSLHISRHHLAPSPHSIPRHLAPSTCPFVAWYLYSHGLWVWARTVSHVGVAWLYDLIYSMETTRYVIWYVGMVWYDGTGIYRLFEKNTVPGM